MEWIQQNQKIIIAAVITAAIVIVFMNRQEIFSKFAQN